mgnify:CR=1 FL=1
MTLIKARSRGINLADTFAFTGTVSGAGGGKVLQVQVGSISSNFESTTSGTFADVSNLSVAITPASTSNYIYVRADIDYQLFGNSSTTTPEGEVRLLDNSDTVHAATQVLRYASSNSEYGQSGCTLVKYYNPNTTSQITYNLNFKGAGRFLLYGDGGSTFTNPTVITAMEISA